MRRLKVENANIEPVKIINRTLMKDERGFFDRLFCNKELKKILKNRSIKQINHSFTKKRGTLRGLHYQKNPYKEAKIITCLKGKVFDVAVDIRKGSQTYLKKTVNELSDQNNKSIYIPEGFAHGFQTMKDNCILVYFHTEFYNKKSSGYVNPLDPKLEIEWPLSISIISDIDKNTKFL